MINGIIPMYKPKNWSSFDVVNIVKSLLHQRKVGHLGTLDPMATGVLLVTTGSATKLFDIMQQKTKTYTAIFKFGVLTDTLDAMGKIVETVDIIPTLKQIESVLPKFIGNISQIPPKYSAKSVNGKRAYELARNNIDFELKAKNVLINDIKIVNYSNGELTVNIKCGSGTYIRSIGRDIAQELNTVATMTSLIRTSIDSFKLEDCYNITDLNEQNIKEKIIPLNSLLKYPEINADSNLIFRFLNGQTVITELKDGLYKLNENNITKAIIEVVKNKAKMKIFLV